MLLGTLFPDEGEDEGCCWASSLLVVVVGGAGWAWWWGGEGVRDRHLPLPPLLVGRDGGSGGRTTFRWLLRCFSGDDDGSTGRWEAASR